MKINRVKKVAIRADSNDVNDMLERQNFTKMPSFLYEFENVAIGWLGGEASDTNENLFICTGEPINQPDIAEIKDYTDAVRILPGFDGAFNAIYFDKTYKKMVIVSDFLGLQPLYLFKTEKNLIAASETKAFNQPQRDLAGWGAFISLGFLLGNRTLLRHVSRFPPATILIYDIVTKEMVTKSYWDAPKIKDSYNIQDIIESFNQSLLYYSELSPNNSELLLSGGFDSRLILFSLISLGFKPDAIILSHPDEHNDLDGFLAKHCAKIFGIKYRKIIPPDNFFSSRHYLEFLNLNDASTPSLFLFISKILFGFSDHIPDFCWEGFIPGYALVVPDYHGIDLKSFVESKTNKMNWNILEDILEKQIVEEMFESYNKDLQRELQNYDNDNNAICEFYTRNKGRHRTSINPLQVFANHTRPLLPGMTKNFFDLVMAIPFHVKYNHKFYLELFEQTYPEACRFPFMTGGALKTSRKNLEYWKAYLRMGLFKYIQEHPSITQPIGLYKNFSSHSLFFENDLLFDDPAINADILKTLTPSDPRYLPAWKMVFHWKAWELVHNGRIFELLNDGNSE